MLAVSFASAVSEAQTTNLAGSGDPFTFNFDENGNGLIDLRAGAGFQPNPGFMAPDPTQPGNPLVLMYLLPAPTVNGDVRIWEDSSGTVLSDVLRFTDAAGDLSGQNATLMIFYSLPDEGPPALADTGIPTALVPIDGGGTFEVGDNFQWAPGGVWDNVYNGISNIPEPGAPALLALGGLVWLWGRRRFVRRGRNEQRTGPVKPTKLAGRFLLAFTLLACIGAADLNAATQSQVAAYVQVNILGGSYGDVNLWMTDTNYDSSYVARDLDPAVPDIPFPFAQTWLVMIDDEPKANFGHEVRWVFVSDDLSANTVPTTNDFPPTVWANLGAGPEVNFACAGVTPLPCPPTNALPAAAAPGPGADNSCLHAVLISGGIDAANNKAYYAKNLQSMYNKLRACGYPKANIFTYYADGGAILDSGGNNFVTAGAVLATIRAKIQMFCQTLNPQRDVLFIYTSNHGSKGKGLDLWAAAGKDPNYLVNQFAADTANASVCRLFVIMDQCYSGQFTPVASDGVHKNMVISTAAKDDEPSICRHYMSFWEQLNPATTTFQAMQKSVAASMAGPLSTCDGGGNFCELCTVNGDCPGSTCSADKLSTPTYGEGTPGNGNYIICNCCGVLYDSQDKWVQPLDTTPNGLDVRATLPKTLADDFLCTATGPITRIRIWGSWLFDLVPTNACFCLGIWSDVPATNGFPSHPGQQLCTTCFTGTNYIGTPYVNLGYPGVYTNGVYELFFDPNSNAIIGQDNVIWQYTFNIPTNITCAQTNGTIYWLSVSADCFDPNQFQFGWKTSPIHFKDDAVFSDDLINWPELRDPRTGQSLDLSFTVATPVPPTNAVLKWLQRPDLTPTGLDVLAGNAANQAGASIRLIADDFLCQASGYITDISIWGSWLNDQFDPNATFTLSFWGDVPPVGAGPSHPGNLLWQWTFGNADYTSTLVSSGVLEGFFDPSCPTMLRGNDTQVYQYDFDVPAPAAFYQTNGNIYWLSVESCNTHLGLFGWKTCILSDRFGDDAVWTWLLPPSWGAMVYPPGHPYVGQSMDMSFLLGTVPVADPAGPHVTQQSPPALSAIASGNGSLTISWTASGAILQSAPEITGPWTDVSGAASPYLLPTDKPRCFYRVYVP
jgi:hypothetical protein